VSEPRKHRVNGRSVITGALVLACLAGAAWAVISRGPELVDALQKLSWSAVLASFAFGSLAVLALFMSWLAAVTDGGIELGARDGLRIYGVGQIGKYLPGSVWPVLTQAQLGKRRGIPPMRMASGALLALAISVCAGLVMGCLLLPFSGDQAAHRLWWAPFMVIPLVIVLAPPVLNRLLGVAARALRRGPVEGKYSLRGIMRSACWAAIGNILFGAHIYCLAAPLGAHSVRGFLLSVCAYSLASSVGVLVIFAPAGAGAREAVLTAVLAPVLSIDAALAIALVSRVVLIAVDVILALSQLPGLRLSVDPTAASQENVEQT
jgi:glycosyltransferase 2 family protein